MQLIPSQLTELPGENFDTLALSEVASWITIYSELAGVLRSIIASSGEDEEATELRINLAWIEERLSRWRARHAELAGVHVDPNTRTVGYAGQTVTLTRREADLLAFMLAHPDRAFTPRQLALEAWNNPRLSDAQVRTYMMRLRRRLVDLGVGNIIRVIKRHGYVLGMPRAHVDGHASGASRPSPLT